VVKDFSSYINPGDLVTRSLLIPLYVNRIVFGFLCFMPVGVQIPPLLCAISRLSKVSGFLLCNAQKANPKPLPVSYLIIDREVKKLPLAGKPKTAAFS
jgi:hypothetical protein